MNQLDDVTLHQQRERLIQRLEEQTLVSPTYSGVEEKEIVLTVRGVREAHKWSESFCVVLGRTGRDDRYPLDMDLTIYGAFDRGISRRHARLHVENNQLWVTDLGSTNGTFINDQRLTPHIPTLITLNDDLRLSSLGIKLSFQ
ncbi:MAG: FHA domain-containing protein [Anaerolineae bacterium]|jgi:hypothetical protein|nr:FHA domain-containing protein [Anaerolineae bacterium]